MAKVRVKQEEIKKVDPAEVPEVQRFLVAKGNIDRFKAANPMVFTQLEALVEEYNAALQESDKVLRARRTSCGPFDLYSIACKYNAEKLHDELGEESFLKVGGIKSKVTEFSLNEPLFEAMIERGEVPAEVVEVVRTFVPNFHKPKPLLIP